MKKRSKMVEKTELDQINTIFLVSKRNRKQCKYASRYNKIDQDQLKSTCYNKLSADHIYFVNTNSYKHVS
jgi:hypothetical protein